jgi:hypothetical protein
MRARVLGGALGGRRRRSRRAPSVAALTRARQLDFPVRLRFTRVIRRSQRLGARQGRARVGARKRTAEKYPFDSSVRAFTEVGKYQYPLDSKGTW